MKIKIAILINDFFFNNYRTFYDELKNRSSIFDVIVLAVDGYGDEEKNSHAISKFLSNIGVENIDSNNNGKLFSLKNYNPDYVFYLVPYDCYFPNEYNSTEVSKYANVCTISYGASMINNVGLYDSLSKNEFFDNAKFVFIETNYKLNFEMYNKNFVPIGYLKLESYLPYIQKKNNSKRKKILWKPRWTLDVDCNFWNNINEIINFIKNNKSLDFYIYFHPLFMKKVKEKGCEEEFNMVYNILKTLENYHECGYSDFLIDVLSSDILIADHSSTIVEFASTGRPIIYCDSPIELNQLGKDIIENNYVSHSGAETVYLLSNLINEIDPKKEKRNLDRYKYYFYPPNNMTVSNYLVNLIEKDFNG